MNKKRFLLLILCICFISASCSNKKNQTPNENKTENKNSALLNFKIVGDSGMRFCDERAWAEYTDSEGNEQIALIDTEGRILTQYSKKDWPNYKAGKIEGGLTYISTVALESGSTESTLSANKDKIILLTKNGRELFLYDQPAENDERLECIGVKSGIYLFYHISPDNNDKNKYTLNLCAYDTTISYPKLNDYGELETATINDLKFSAYKIYDDLREEFIIEKKNNTNQEFHAITLTNECRGYDRFILNDVSLDLNIDSNNLGHFIFYDKDNSPIYGFVTTHMKLIWEDYSSGIHEINDIELYWLDHGRKMFSFLNPSKEIYLTKTMNPITIANGITISSIDKDHAFISGFSSLNGGGIYVNVTTGNESLEKLLKLLTPTIGYESEPLENPDINNPVIYNRSDIDQIILSDTNAYDFSYKLDEGYTFAQLHTFSDNYALINIKDQNGTEYFTLLDKKGKELYAKIKGHVICFSQGYVLYSDDNIQIIDTEGTPHTLTDDLSFLPDKFEMFDAERNEYVISGGYKNIHYINDTKNEYDGFISLDNKKSITSLRIQ